jgi:RNA polymerase sigma-54 factor
MTSGEPRRLSWGRSMTTGSSWAPTARSLHWRESLKRSPRGAFGSCSSSILLVWELATLQRPSRYRWRSSNWRSRFWRRSFGITSPGPSPGYIVPDVTLRRFGDEWHITSNNEAIPTLKVSPRYRSMLRSGSDADDETRRYLKDKIRSAESFIRNVDRRKDTVSRITQIILEVQRDFFEDGKGLLRPLRLEDVAVEIGVHLSTISRGVTGKYMATPYGLFELKHFFSGGYRTTTGMDVAATSIKQRLRELVNAEDPVHPLSDQRLAEMLSDEGVTVARRTVAKYREELRIDPSWARRRR